MVFGISLQLYTALHVLVSLIGIGTGLVVTTGLLRRKILSGWTATFLVSTILTSVSGFGFPFEKLLPSHILGILSLIALAIAVYSVYLRRLAGAWRNAYVVTALLSFYFNAFVLVVQAFLKTPALHALAPTQKEPPFAVAQLGVLVIFVGATVIALRKPVPAA